METNKSDIEELVRLLDESVTNGVGSINVKTNLEASGINVETFKSTDCNSNNMPCNIPTIHKDIDDK